MGWLTCGGAVSHRLASSKHMARLTTEARWKQHNTAETGAKMGLEPKRHSKEAPATISSAIEGPSICHSVSRLARCVRGGTLWMHWWRERLPPLITRRQHTDHRKVVYKPVQSQRTVLSPRASPSCLWVRGEGIPESAAYRWTSLQTQAPKSDVQFTCPHKHLGGYNWERCHVGVGGRGATSPQGIQTHYLPAVREQSQLLHYCAFTFLDMFFLKITGGLIIIIAMVMSLWVNHIYCASTPLFLPIMSKAWFLS